MADESKFDALIVNSGFGKLRILIFSKAKFEARVRMKEIRSMMA